MSQHELGARFLTRTQGELAQMRACLPDGPIAIEPLAMAHLALLAHKVASAAEAFGFPEIAVIAGAIELLSQASIGRTVRERLELTARLTAQLSALEVHIEYELAERDAAGVPEELPMSAQLPGFGVRRK
jgi:HPt (histidine-containing phosphotransfer) domain-containing protein